MSNYNSNSSSSKSNCGDSGDYGNSGNYGNGGSNNNSKSNVILKFGSPQTTQMPVAIGSDSITIASLRINTSAIKNPCIKLDFVTNLNVFGITAGTIKFQIYKQYENQVAAIPVGNPFVFGPIAIGYEPISFFVPDCDNSCCDNKSCSLYTVEVSAAELIVGEIGYAAFNNAMLSALIVPQNECQCN